MPATGGGSQVHNIHLQKGPDMCLKRAIHTVVYHNLKIGCNDGGAARGVYTIF